MLTDKDLNVLIALARYFVLSRPQLQKFCFPWDASGRSTRRRLEYLYKHHLINKKKMLFGTPSGGVPASVYYPTTLGLEIVSERLDDDRFMAVSTRSPIDHCVPHWLALSETHVAFDQAIALQNEVSIDRWINEYDVVNHDAAENERKYRLFTLLRESPKLVCAPDAAFLLNARGYKKAFYVEQDRNTTGSSEVGARKFQGYALMAELGSHRIHFPETNIGTFGVLLVAPTPRRRDHLRAAFKGKAGESLWLFVDENDLKPESLLHEPIFYPCEGDPVPLVKKREGQ